MTVDTCTLHPGTTRCPCDKSYVAADDALNPATISLYRCRRGHSEVAGPHVSAHRGPESNCRCGHPLEWVRSTVINA